MGHTAATIWILTLLLTSAACAGRIAPVAPGSATEPRVSWTVKSGPAGENGREVCRSDSPAPCVLQATSEAQPMSVTVSVFLYDAGATTTYQGAFLSEFIASSKPIGHETKVDYAIEPGKRPTAFSVMGPVTSKPGEYRWKMALLSAVPGQPDPRQVANSVPVRVVTGSTRATS